MKKFINNLIFGKDQKTVSVLVLGILLTVGLGCSFIEKQMEVKRDPIPSEYAGVWENDKGDALKIFKDGKGDYTQIKNSGATISTSQGCLYYDEKKNELVCAFKGNETKPIKVFSIDKTPRKDEMKLNGDTFVLEEDLEEKEKPTEKEALKLAEQTILDINEGILEKDFENFYDKLSNRYRQQTTPDELKKNFQPFIDKEFDFKPIKTVDGEIKESEVRNSGGRSELRLEGFYKTKPKTNFIFLYLWQNDGWKLHDVTHFSAKN